LFKILAGVKYDLSAKILTSGFNFHQFSSGFAKYIAFSNFKT